MYNIVEHLIDQLNIILPHSCSGFQLFLVIITNLLDVNNIMYIDIVR